MLNCSTCALTQHHCCKASIAFDIMETIHLSKEAEKLGINIRIIASTEKPNYFNIVRKNKPFRSLNDENCVFLRDGRCRIYNSRPAVCRVYGTKLVECWFASLDYATPIDDIFAMTSDTVHDLTEKALKANEQRAIEFFQEKMKIK